MVRFSCRRNADPAAPRSRADLIFYLADHSHINIVPTRDCAVYARTPTAVDGVDWTLCGVVVEHRVQLNGGPNHDSFYVRSSTTVGRPTAPFTTDQGGLRFRLVNMSLPSYNDPGLARLPAVDPIETALDYWCRTAGDGQPRRLPLPKADFASGSSTCRCLATTTRASRLPSFDPIETALDYGRRTARAAQHSSPSGRWAQLHRYQVAARTVGVAIFGAAEAVTSSKLHAAWHTPDTDEAVPTVEAATSSKLHAAWHTPDTDEAVPTVEAATSSKLHAASHTPDTDEAVPTVEAATSSKLHAASHTPDTDGAVPSPPRKKGRLGDAPTLVPTAVETTHSFAAGSWASSRTGFPEEDTEIHAILHTLLKEIFDDDALVIVGANGESKSSKAHRSTYQKNAAGKKADGRVMSANFEEVFLETKSSKHADTAPCNIYGQFTRRNSCKLIRDTLEIYQMELKHDGLYTMVHLGSCRIPRRIEDMWLLPPLIDALLFVKARILASVKEQTRRRYESDDLELHLSSGPPSDEEFDAEERKSKSPLC
ncbi:hypothetical protein HDU86_003395 [Geranomyces michiganensis]|nr:hypothetical protein HDU86_003395 [Geranomyces michiganensis]